MDKSTQREKESEMCKNEKKSVIIQQQDVKLINEKKEGCVFHLVEMIVVVVLTNDWREAVVIFITMSQLEIHIYEVFITDNIPEMKQSSTSEALKLRGHFF